MLEFSGDMSLKLTFEDYLLVEFWSCMKSDYPEPANKDLKIISFSLNLLFKRMLSAFLLL